MKKFILTAFVVATVFAANAQGRFQMGDNNQPFLTYGLDFGINRSQLSFENATGSSWAHAEGYRFGFVTNLNFTDRFSIVPKAELSFSSAKVDGTSDEFNVKFSQLELMAHMKFKTSYNRFSPYILAGPNVRIPIMTRTQEGGFYTNEDIAIDLGAGLDIPIFRLTLSPEVRYTFGVKDIQSGSSLGDFKHNNIALMLVLSGL